MQSSKYLIFNISGMNPNVMLELGLSYGLGKETIIIRDKETKTVSDIAGIEYIEYNHAFDLQKKLGEYFEEK
ncbi:MAG: nucleotide-binding protein [Clostridium sp.]|jgi:predicted nucleotide-binding protein|nr:TIR domain-containing protein [Clostridium sp.]MCH3965526.1 nucleotide-binding protein [Clostridium sp.]